MIGCNFRSHLKTHDSSANVLAGTICIFRVVVALGDSVTTAEIFGHPALFDRSRDDLVRSFVLDAVSQDIAPAQTPPKAVAAATFLKDAIASRAVGEQAAGSAVQEELDGASTRSFKTKGKDGELLHFNAYAK